MFSSWLIQTLKYKCHQKYFCETFLPHLHTLKRKQHFRLISPDFCLPRLIQILTRNNISRFSGRWEILPFARHPYLLFSRKVSNQRIPSSHSAPPPTFFFFTLWSFKNTGLLFPLNHPSLCYTTLPRFCKQTTLHRTCLIFACYFLVETKKYIIDTQQKATVKVEIHLWRFFSSLKMNSY